MSKICENCKHWKTDRPKDEFGVCDYLTNIDNIQVIAYLDEVIPVNESNHSVHYETDRYFGCVNFKKEVV